MEPNVVIRPAGEADIETVRALAAAIWHEYYPGIISPAQVEYMLAMTYSPEAIRRAMADGTVFELALASGHGAAGGAADAGTPVGYLAWSHDQPDAVVTLHRLYLLPRLHGRGLGRQMIDHVKAAARRAGARAVRLQVNKGNARAIRAYERAGFAIAESIAVDIGGGFVMDDFVMRARV